MNVVSIACPACRAQYRVKLENVGRKAKCAKCGQLFVVSAPVQEPAHAHPAESDGLLVCRYCGFQDSGYFCSNCGGRLAGEPPFDFESCKVPSAYLSHLPAELSYDLDGPSQKQEEQRRRYELRQRCEHFNEELDEMARVIKYQGIDEVDWRFNRLNVGRLVDSLPPDVPGRDEIATRLWTIVSDVERAAAKRDADEQTEEVRQALKTGDTKKAEKTLVKLRELTSDPPTGVSAALIAELESELQRLQSDEVGEKQSAAFQKLLDKADKLAFQHETKKAVKAYQECLFWLSRNELPDKERVQTEVEHKVRVLEANSAG